MIFKFAYKPVAAAHREMRIVFFAVHRYYDRNFSGVRRRYVEYVVKPVRFVVGDDESQILTLAAYPFCLVDFEFGY